jgi:hypothetical protein
MRLLASLCLTACVGACFTAALACAQSQTGEIRLDVKDETGAAIEASGSIEGLATGVHRDFATDGQGAHTLTGLPFGIYRLQIGRDGFATQSIRLEVRSAAPIMRTIVLPIAAVATTVEVSDSVTLVNPQATSAAQYIRPDELRDRESSGPGRSFIDLVNQQPTECCIRGDRNTRFNTWWMAFRSTTIDRRHSRRAWAWMSSIR